MTALTFPTRAWSPVFGVSDERQESDGRLQWQDFASHLRMVRTRFTAPGDAPSLYSPQAHLDMMGGWIGPDAHKALPFGYSPTMWLLLAPLGALSDPAAYLVWTALGLAGVLWMIRPRIDPWLAGGLAVLTPVAARTFALGQTAALTTAGLVWLLVASPMSRPGRGRFLLDVAVLWALSAKPPVALVAGAALLARGQWRTVVAAVGLAGLTTAAAWPWLGSDWVADYTRMARTYDAERADPAFAWSLEPLYMSNLRAVLYQTGVSDSRAASASWLVWLVCLLVLVIAGWRRALPPQAVSALFVLSYVSFAPHVNGTEDLHLYVVALLLGWLGRGRPEAIAQWAPYLVIASLFVASRGSLGSPTWTGAAFAAKLALVALTLTIARAVRSPVSGVTDPAAPADPSTTFPPAATGPVRAGDPGS